MNHVQFNHGDFVKSSLPNHKWVEAWIQVAIKNDAVGLRDSNDPNIVTLRFTTDEWPAFVEGAKAGEFDLPKFARRSPTLGRQV